MTFRKILTASYNGTYRIGCSGGPDARYMLAMTAAAVVATDPGGLIFDFTFLDYKWGDDLERVYRAAEDWPYRGANLPWAVVLGPQCREAVISLECGLKQLQEPAEWMFGSFEDAMRYVDERVQH